MNRSKFTSTVKELKNKIENTTDKKIRMKFLNFLKRGEQDMEVLTLNIKNKNTSEKLLWFLKHFEEDGVEIIKKEDLEDLKLLTATRNETAIPFEEYLENGN